MNPELYERYLAKKAKKLGISVEELKAQGTSSPVKEESAAQTAPQQTSTPEPQYVHRLTIRRDRPNTPEIRLTHQPLCGWKRRLS